MNRLAAGVASDVAAAWMVIAGGAVHFRIGVSFNERTLFAPLWKMYETLRPAESEQFLLAQVSERLPALVPAHIARLERALERQAPGAVVLVDRYTRALSERSDSTALRAALQGAPAETALQLLYWKHSREVHQEGRVRLPALCGLANRSQYLVLREHPLHARCPCPMCGEPAELAIGFVATQRSDVRLSCSACSHRTSLEFIESDSQLQDFPVAMCPCEVCGSVRDESAERLYEWCQTFSVRLAELLTETAKGVAGAYQARGAYHLSPSGELIRRGVSRGRFVEYLVASTLTAGPAEDALRSVLHWGIRGVFARMLIERFGLRPAVTFPHREPIEVLKQAVAGPHSASAQLDGRQERLKAEQLTRLLAGYSRQGHDFRSWLAACVSQIGRSRVLMLPLEVTLSAPRERTSWSWRALHLERRAVQLLRKLGYTVIAPGD
jgi:hypothetical protein